MAEKAFQPVNMTSVCDDVTLTIREALVDEKSIYLILDYQLPDSVDPETVEIAYNSRENTQRTTSNFQWSPITPQTILPGRI